MDYKMVSCFRRFFAVITFITISMPVYAVEYEVDPSHTFIQFQISHLGYSTLNGRFNQMSGNFNWDKTKPENSAVEIIIKTPSVDTNWAERDKHIRSNDFLDVDKFPTATFKSTKFTGDAAGGKLEGVLTLHGVSKSITMDLKAVGEGDDPWGGYRAGFDAATTLRRADFDMGYDLGPAAETMDFSLHVEGIRK